MSAVLLGLIVCLAFVVEAAAGFGATVVTVTLGALLFPIDYVLAVFVPVNLAMSAYLVARHWRSIDFRLLGVKILPVMFGGLGLGVALFQKSPQGWFKPAFAGFVCALAASQLWSGMRKAQAQPAPLSPVSGAAWLFAGGVIHGVYATGGPMVVYFIGRELPDKGRFRATLSALWLVLNSVLMATYAWSGKLSSDSALVSGGLLVPLMLGIVGGEWLHRKLDPKRFRLFVSVLLLVGGAALLYSSWGQW